MAGTWVIGVVALCAFITFKVVQALRNPLNRIPGPWYYMFTGLPTFYASLIQMRQAQHIYDLHLKYGPFVRTGPDEVDVADLTAFQEIHKFGTKFDKSDYYHFLSPMDAGKPPYGVFQMTDQQQHGKRRRLLAKDFSVSSIRTNWEDVVRDKTERAVRGIQSEATSSYRPDTRKWWTLMALDTISEMIFGKSFNGLETGKLDDFYGWLRESNIANMVAFYMPWLHFVMRCLPIPPVKRLLNAHKKVLNRANEAIVNSRGNSTTKNVFASVLSQADKEDGMTDEEIRSEVGSFVIAGSETTSSTLTYAVWATLNNPALQAQLEEEVAAVEAPLTDAKLEKLTILNAIISETLRLYIPVPGPQPRVTPKGGAMLGRYFFPEGTIVTTEAWALHRNTTAFRNAETFDHSRFLPGGESLTNPNFKIAYSPWGNGARTCIGKNLAMMEMRLVIAEFFRECRGARLCPSATEESMEMMNFILSTPKGEVCRVILPQKQ